MRGLIPSPEDSPVVGKKSVAYDDTLVQIRYDMAQGSLHKRQQAYNFCITLYVFGGRIMLVPLVPPIICPTGKVRPRLCACWFSHPR